MKKTALLLLLAATSGMAKAQCNLVTNGDFSAGATGFTSGYTQSCSTSAMTGPYGSLDMSGAYCVYTNPSAGHSLFNNCTYMGNMLVANGATTTNTAVWSQTVSVMPNTTYRFTVQASSVYPASPAQLVLSVNGSMSGATTLNTTACSWQTLSYTWNSGSATTATLSIYDMNMDASGNDFAIDNISFSTAPTVTTSVMNTVCQGATGAITVTPAGSGGPYMYSLNGGSWQSSNMFSGLTAGTYTVRVANACGDTSMATTTVVGNIPPTVSVTGSTDASYCVCPVIPTGTITIATTGTGPMMYSLNGGNWTAFTTPNTITGLAPMTTYTVRVMDACGNIATASESVYIAKKMKVMHYTNSAKNPSNIICIDSPAVAAHIANHSHYNNPSQHDYVMNPCTMIGAKMAAGGNEFADISVAPNPNNGMFTVKLTALEAEGSMIITDVQGKVVRKAVVAEGETMIDVNISELGKGLYFISVMDGHHTYKAKVVSE